MSAIGKYFRAIGYLFTGRIDQARRAIQTNPHVVRATFDRVITEKKERIHQYKDAVSRLIANQEKKSYRLKQLSEEVNRLEQLKEGAAAKARITVNELKGQGKGLPEIKQNEDYQQCMAAYNDFSGKITGHTEQIADLESEINELSGTIGGHKVQLQQLLREIDKLKDESSATVADMITAKEEAEIADMISGISEDRTSQELAELRDLRAESKAKARISREVAGTDTKVQENEFLAYAQADTRTSEFDQLIGLAEESGRRAPGSRGRAGGAGAEAAGTLMDRGRGVGGFLLSSGAEWRGGRARV